MKACLVVIVSGLVLVGGAQAQKRPTPDMKRLNELLFPKREATNEAHERLMKMSQGDREEAFAALLKASGEKCGKVTRTFFQGAASNGDAFWNVACSNGGPLSIQINADKEGSTKILECSVLKAINAGECFKAFPKQ